MPQIYQSYAGHCVEFLDSDFTTAALPPLGLRVQTPQFQNFRYEADYGYEAEWGWCPPDERGIVPLSRDEAFLHARIDEFMGHDGTGTNNAVKWGVALLDPSTQPLIAALAADDVVVSDFADRPAPYSATRSTKFMVVMTDGNIRYQNRPTPAALTNDWFSAFNAPYVDVWGDGPKYCRNGSCYSTAQNLLSRYGSSLSILSSSSMRTLDEALRSQQFLSMCDVARAKGINVYTIGFDISASQPAFTEMQQCATVPGNFFDVDGAQLYNAFQQITVFVKRLQLTQ